MNIDDYTRIRHKRLNITNDNLEEKKIKYLKTLITRVLLSIIIVISVAIFIKIDSNNMMIIEDYVFNDSLKFTKINSWYQDNFGELIPNVNNDVIPVFSSGDLLKNEYTKYLDGVKITVDKNSPISLINGGIVVFIGEKSSYGNTLIIQGNDGIDYWYGGITNTSVNLYDYLEKDTLIGEAKENYLYLILQKDGKYISYEEYIK